MLIYTIQKVYKIADILMIILRENNKGNRLEL
jgi:flagellar basal body L-ring protein FlgH